MADNLTLAIRSERYDTGQGATKARRHKEKLMRSGRSQ